MNDIVEIWDNIYLDCYQHLIDQNDIDIELLWGGRDSGKSKLVAQLFLEQSMKPEYFRCLLIKQTHESIEGAQWQMIKDVAEEWGVDHKFTFKTSPLSIRCPNGNTFATRGMDKPAKIKSFSNPSHAWIEEGNQLSEDSFITLLTSLRSDYGRIKLFITFNPETDTPDYADFWIYKTFFKKYEPLQSFTGEWVINAKLEGIDKEVKLKYRCTHTTYHDNPFISLQRIAIHESLEEFNPYWYRVFTLGLWGNKENDSPWAFAFSRNKHFGMPEAKMAENLYLSFDFNRNPAACLVIQWYDAEIKVLESIKLPRSGTDALCDYILLHYPGYIYVITGDYSGHTPSSVYKEEVTNYLVIKKKLNLSDGQIKVKPNPRLEHNQTLVNAILYYYKVTIHQVKARGLIFDLENVKKTADGKIEKTDRKDPAQQADICDCFRYFCNVFLGDFKPPV